MNRKNRKHNKNCVLNTKLEIQIADSMYDHLHGVAFEIAGGHWIAGGRTAHFMEMNNMEAAIYISSCYI